MSEKTDLFVDKQLAELEIDKKYELEPGRKGINQLENVIRDVAAKQSELYPEDRGPQNVDEVPHDGEE